MPFRKGWHILHSSNYHFFKFHVSSDVFAEEKIRVHHGIFAILISNHLQVQTTSQGTNSFIGEGQTKVTTSYFWFQIYHIDLIYIYINNIYLNFKDQSKLCAEVWLRGVYFLKDYLRLSDSCIEICINKNSTDFMGPESCRASCRSPSSSSSHRRSFDERINALVIFIHRIHV